MPGTTFGGWVTTKMKGSDDIYEIINSMKFLELLTSEETKVFASLKKLGIKFERLNELAKDMERAQKQFVLSEIEYYSLYEITEENISALYDKNRIDAKTDFMKIMSDILLSKKTERFNDSMNEYIMENVNLFYVNVLSNFTKFTNSAQSVLTLLNSDLHIQHKKEYIDKLQTEIENLESVKDRELWEAIMQNSCVQPTFENIVSFFKFTEFELTITLIEFFEKNRVVFNLDDIRTAKITELINQIVEKTEFSKETYSYLISNLAGYKYVLGKEIEFSLDHIDILMQNNMIDFSIEYYLQTFKKIREIYYEIGPSPDGIRDDVLAKVLDVSYKIYWLNLECLEPTGEEVAYLLLNTKQSVKQKKILIDACDQPISINHTSMKNEKIINHILKNNFNQDDLYYIIEDGVYEKFVGCREEILRIFAQNKIRILGEKLIIPPRLLLDFFRRYKPQDEHYKLIPLVSMDITVRELIDIFEARNLNVFADLLTKNKRPKILKNEKNELLLNFLVERKLISSFDHAFDHFVAYPKRNKQNTIIEK